MPKLPPIPPVITTTLMFGVLCLMLWMNSPAIFVNTPPYDELDSCLVKNILYQRERNKILFNIVTDSERHFHDRVPDLDVKSYFVQSRTDETLATLNHLLNRIITGDTTEVIRDSILNSITNYRSDLLAQTNSSYHAFILKLLPLNADQLSQALYNFHKIPLANKKTVAYALQNYLPLIEKALLEQLLVESSGCSLPFTIFDAITYTKKPWYHGGDKVTATCQIMVLNRTLTPEIRPNTGYIKSVNDAIGTWVGTSNTLGMQKVSGVSILAIKTDTATRPWSFEYLVVAPGASISFDKMHVLYPNIPTTVTISAPGYEAAKLKLRVQGATVEQTGDGQFKITANTKAKKLWAYLDAENEEGNITTLEGMELKIMPPPLPDITINGYLERALPITALQSHLQIDATPVYHDDSTGYTIHSFEYSLLQYNKKTATEPVHVEGAVLPQITGATSGDKLIITDIHYSDEYGNSYEPQTISYYLLNRL